jgi:tetratricopeptide (TPR) repeat protein
MPNARRFPPPWTIGEKTTPALLSATTPARACQQDHFSNNFHDDGCSVDVLACVPQVVRRAIGWGISMPLARATKIIAALLIGFFLSVPHAASAQEPNEAATLTQQIIQLYKQGQYSEATPLAQRLLTISEPLGPDHPDVANSLNILGALYRLQGRYAQAEPLLKRALSIREKTFGPDHSDVAQSLNNLASVYEAQGRYTDAEPFYKRSMAIREKALGPDHPDVATALNNLAGLYKIQARYAEAEPLYKRALAINEKALGPDHPNVAGSQNNLGTLYDDQGRYADAEPLYKRSLAIREKALGPDHPDVGISLNNLAGLSTRRVAMPKPSHSTSAL